jgi:hypothetical protein
MHREARMAATLEGVLRQDSNRRREKRERKASEMPVEQLRALNLCAGLLSALTPEAALIVVTRLQRGLIEHIQVQARGGW